MAIPKDYRLTLTNTRVSTFHKQGKRITSPFFSLLLLPTHFTHGGFAVVVSTKAEKSAVKRNRIRRVTQEIVTKHFDEFKAFDFIMYIKKPALLEKNHVLEEDIVSMAKKVQAL